MPAQWVESPAGLPVRRDPDAYAPRIPSATLRTWRNWLCHVRSLPELEKFEHHRKPKELEAVVNFLESEQLARLQQRLGEWGIVRDWLPAAITDAEKATPPQPAEPSAPSAAPASPSGQKPEQAKSSPPAPSPEATTAADNNVNIPNNERGGWLPAEVCVFGQWIAGFWRHVTTGEWRSPLGKKPLTTPEAWRLA